MTDWSDPFRRVQRSLRRVLPTKASFSSELVSLCSNPRTPLDGLVFEWRHFHGEQEAVAGTSVPDRDPDYSEKRDGPDCRLLLWRHLADGEGSTGPSLQDVAAEAWACFDEFWCAEGRSAKSGLRDLKNSSLIASQAAAAFDECAREGRRIAVLFIDLDNFKQVNDQISEEQGDKVIERLATFLEEESPIGATPLHNGGDEFVVVFPHADSEEALDCALRIIDRGGAFDFDSGTIELGLSIGIGVYPEIAECLTFQELVKIAYKALKEEAKAKAKGTARFPIVSHESRMTSATGLKLATCLVKSSLAADNPQTFASPWLNVIAQRVSISYQNGGDSTVADTVIETAKLQLHDGGLVAQIPREQGVDTDPTVSFPDLGFAVISGIMHAAARNGDLAENVGGMRMKCGPAGVQIVSTDGTVLWTRGVVDDSAPLVDCGDCWSIDDPGATDVKDGALAILVQIGHEPNSVPSAVLAERIVIDDRPTRGGGLPDFWELTLARILDSLDARPNVREVFVIGNREHAVESIKWLLDPDAWNDVFVQSKTTLGPDVISSGKARLKENVHVIDDLDKLLGVLYPDVLARQVLSPSPPKSPLQQRVHFIQRDVRLDTAALGTEDGIRVKTIAEAYPFALEILRRSEQAGDRIVRDQAGQELKELVDFKVELTEPASDQIPAFYSNEEQQLKTYYRKQFRENGGIFWDALQAGSQYTRVVEHVAAAISGPEPYATRRAILVVPHVPPEQGDLAPLGLVSMRCVPRISGRTALLNFSFVWRTVEALVGFPYSLFGSVRFAQDFLDDVRKDIPGDDRVKPELGRVSYVALSLHIFVEEAALSIARQIVNEASE